MSELKFSLSRTIVICAQRSLVFRFFTDSNLFADWWGAGSEIEGKPGGSMIIRYPEGTIASGKVLEITSNERVVFTYGYESGTPIPSGASVVTITLRDHPDGTELTLQHDFANASVRDMHVGGWRYQLALFANVAAREQHKNIDRLMDDYFAAWNNADANARLQSLKSIVTANVIFRDAYGCIAGIEELNAHIEACQQYMPNIILQRDGQTQQCQGTAVCRWIAPGKEGSSTASGVNVFDLAPDGPIKRIVGFWKS